MAIARQRTLNGNVLHTGKVILWGQYPYVRNAWQLYNTQTSDCKKGRATDNPFLSVHTENCWPVLNGVTRYSNGAVYYELKDAPITGVYQPLDPALHGELSSAEMQSLCHDAVLRSSPNKVGTNVPAFIGELKDIPDLVRLFHQPRLVSLFRGDVGKAVKGLHLGHFLTETPTSRRWWATPKGKSKLLKRNRLLECPTRLAAVVLAAEQSARLHGELNLWWRFGLAPFLSDLAKLMEFGEAVNRRLQILLRLRDKGTYRKHVRLGKGSYQAPEQRNVALETQTCSIYGTIYDTWSWERWASVQWKLDPGFTLPANFLQLWNLAVESLYGLSVSGLAEAAWELTPWSWLVDWFLHLDDLVALCRNTIPCYVKSVCFMQTTTSSRVVRITTPTPAGVRITYPQGGYGGKAVRKFRQPVAGWFASLPSLPTLPYLTAGQWSILGSLAATKTRKPRAFRS